MSAPETIRVANWTICSAMHPDGWYQWYAWLDGARKYGPLGQDPGVKTFATFGEAMSFVAWEVGNR